jgi:hypothetical protein
MLVIKDAIFKQIEANGGSTTKLINDSVTHLIASQKDFDKPSAKGKGIS